VPPLRKASPVGRLGYPVALGLAVHVGNSGLRDLVLDGWVHRGLLGCVS